MNNPPVIEAINTFTFNKSKRNVLILIHGLFGNSGYWLPFLSFFSEFKILILDINYEKFFSEKHGQTDLHVFFELIMEGKENCILLSHSIGTVLAKTFPEKKVKMSYEICPIRNSIGANKNDFIGEIMSLTSYSKEEIERILKEATTFLSSNMGIKSALMNRKQYLPRNDVFFNDSVECGDEYFDGDHFDISSAIVMIKNDLSIVMR